MTNSQIEDVGASSSLPGKQAGAILKLNFPLAVESSMNSRLMNSVMGKLIIPFISKPDLGKGSWILDLHLGV